MADATPLRAKVNSEGSVNCNSFRIPLHNTDRRMGVFIEQKRVNLKTMAW